MKPIPKFMKNKILTIGNTIMTAFEYIEFEDFNDFSTTVSN